MQHQCFIKMSKNIKRSKMQWDVVHLCRNAQQPLKQHKDC